MTITLDTWDDAREALRSRDLRQALYDEGRSLMADVIVNLHGDEHVARRRLENRLFRRDTFAWYERERIPAIVADQLAGPLAEGRCDLLPIARRTMMTLSIDVAGVERPRTGEAMTRFFGLMEEMARAATVAHATGDKTAIVERGDRALAAFESEYYRPALTHRRALVDEAGRGERDAADLPRDVLTTLLVNADDLDLPPDTVLREVAYYPWVGAHSTSNQFVHAMHHLFEWVAGHPGERDAVAGDAARRQRFVHESMRLHPASPVAVRKVVADVRLRSGRVLPAGEEVLIHIERANRDPSVVGSAPDRFDPDRTLADGVPRWGLSFGTGTHACLGRELAGGLSVEEAAGNHLLGAVTIMAGELLSAHARPDPDDPATPDTTTTREQWGRYPVLLG